MNTEKMVNWLTWAMVLVVIISLISGIVLGLAARTPSAKALAEYSEYLDDVEKYPSLYKDSDAPIVENGWGFASTAAMLGTWLSGGIFALLIRSQIESLLLAYNTKVEVAKISEKLDKKDK